MGGKSSFRREENPRFSAAKRLDLWKHKTYKEISLQTKTARKSKLSGNVCKNHSKLLIPDTPRHPGSLSSEGVAADDCKQLMINAVPAVSQIRVGIRSGTQSTIRGAAAAEAIAA